MDVLQKHRVPFSARSAIGLIPESAICLLTTIYLELTLVLCLSISCCSPAPAESAAMSSTISSLLVNQGQLVFKRLLLAALTKTLEYTGALVNFGCLAVAVFGGAWKDVADKTPGGMAAQVSLGSFYLLTLIYSFTQVWMGGF